MQNKNKPLLDKKKFIDSLLSSLKLKNTSREEKNELRDLLTERLDRYLIDAFFDSLGTMELQQLDFLQELYPKTDPTILLLLLSRTMPHLEAKVKEQAELLKTEVMDLMQTIRNTYPTT